MNTNREHYTILQRSNSAASNALSESLQPGRPGFKMVIDQFQGRASGGTNVRCEINASDNQNSSFNQADTTQQAGQKIASTFRGPHSFGEGRDVTITVQGDGTATTCGYTIDYHWEPAVPGALG